MKDDNGKIINKLHKESFNVNHWKELAHTSRLWDLSSVCSIPVASRVKKCFANVSLDTASVSQTLLVDFWII